MSVKGQIFCSECDFVTSKEKRLVKHVRKSHGKCAIKCPFCVNAHYSSSPADLSVHKIHEHRSVKVRCFLCEFSSRSLTKWASHMTQNHSVHLQAVVSLASPDGVGKFINHPSNCKSGDAITHTNYFPTQEVIDHALLSNSKVNNIVEGQQLNSLSHSAAFNKSVSDFGLPESDVIVASQISVDNETKESSPSKSVSGLTNMETTLACSSSDLNVYSAYESHSLTNQRGRDHHTDSPSDHQRVAENQGIHKSLCIPCPHCDLTCASIKELRHHCKTEHGLGPKYSCKLCNYSAVSVSKLVRHMAVHNNMTQSRSPKPVPCPYCELLFTSLQDLGRHCKEIHLIQGPQFKCEHCVYSTRWLYLLVRHMRIHTQEKPYACKLCSYRVCHYTDLYRHMRMHKEERPFACPMCTDRFIQPQHLARHIRFHTQEKPFSCHLCFQPFADSKSLKGHLLRAVCTGSINIKKAMRVGTK